MQWLRTIAGEVLGLFVDDRIFAGAILAWIILAAVVLPRLTMPDAAKGLMLFAGLAAILLTSAVHRARR